MDSTLPKPALVAPQTTPKARTSVYWIDTALLCLQMSFTTCAQLRLPQVAEEFTHLGFPAHFRVAAIYLKAESGELTARSRAAPQETAVPELNVSYGLPTSCASTTATAATCTMSFTSEPRCNTCTGLLNPVSRGPMSSQFPMRWSSL